MPCGATFPHLCEATARPVLNQSVVFARNGPRVLHAEARRDEVRTALQARDPAGRTDRAAQCAGPVSPAGQ